jgi:hypothetical protein
MQAGSKNSRNTGSNEVMMQAKHFHGFVQEQGIKNFLQPLAQNCMHLKLY